MFIAFDDGAFIASQQANPPALFAKVERHGSEHHHPRESGGRILDRCYFGNEKPVINIRSGG